MRFKNLFKRKKRNKIVVPERSEVFSVQSEKMAPVLNQNLPNPNYVEQTPAPAETLHKKERVFFGNPYSFFQKYKFTVLVLIPLFFLTLFYYSSGASPLTFEPETCVGNWQNIGNAEGELDLVFGSPASNFTLQNSAATNNSNQQIICRNFISNIPRNTRVKETRLYLNWSVKGESREEVDGDDEQEFSVLENQNSPNFVISYSLDGTNWVTVAELGYNDLQNIFVLQGLSFDDLSSLQISVESLRNRTQDYRAFLDGMYLRAHYKKPNQLTGAYQATQVFLFENTIVRSCEFRPSSITLNSNSSRTARLMVQFEEDEQNTSMVEIVPAPRGVEVSLSKGRTGLLSRQQDLNVRFRGGQNIQEGSFNIPAIFTTLNGEEVSTASCQLNLIAQ